MGTVRQKRLLGKHPPVCPTHSDCGIVKYHPVGWLALKKKLPRELHILRLFLTISEFFKNIEKGLIIT